MSDLIELLFFDTFAHDNTEELNLDLVQFPKPVYVTEVRIIPLGARVQADFPGGVRLGATNPTQFKIEFFVNDLAKPGASTFESLGGFEYNQNGCINLTCMQDEAVRKIPTDGLVLRGWYTTITLAVYGKLTNNITGEPTIQPPAPTLPQPAAEIPPIEPEWPPPPAEYSAPAPAFAPPDPPHPPHPFGEYYEPPKDPRGYHHAADAPADWDAGKTRNSRRERERGRDWEHERWERGRDRDYTRRSYDREERKRPRTPPLQSPKRPHTPHKEPSPPEAEPSRPEAVEDVKKEEESAATPPVSEEMGITEEFEPILSDEDIVDEEMDYDYSAFTNNDDIIKQFVPGVTVLRNFVPKALFTVTNECVTIDEKLKLTIGIVDDYFKSSIEKYSLERFEQLKGEMKEEFIHLCEKLINIFDSLEHFSAIIKLYFELKNEKRDNFCEDDQELSLQVFTIIETTIEWLKIAIDYDMANIQDSIYKIRHLKCGVRLVEWTCNSREFVQLLAEKSVKIHSILFDLYEREHMALSIKLMIIKALDTYLLHKFAIELFLGCDETSTKENGYHMGQNDGYKSLIAKMRQDPLVRIKFALNSILKKLNLYEVLHNLHGILAKMRNEPELSPDDMVFITKALGQVLGGFQDGQFVFAQPKRFLPVSAQFEIVRAESRNVLVEYFRMFNILQCFFLLLAHEKTHNLSNVKAPIFEILAELLKTDEGLDYLSENIEITNGLVRLLLRNEEELQFTLHNCIEIKSHNLALEIAYKMEALYAIRHLESLGAQNNWDFDHLDVIDQLHALFCLTFSQIGKIAMTEVLGSNISPLFQYLSDLGQKEKSDNLINKLKKSPGIAYIIDLVTFTVVTIPNISFLERNLKYLFQIVDNIDIFDEQIARITELKTYLIPLENAPKLAYDNISHFVEIIVKEMDNITSIPGQVVTSLRVIHHLGVSKYDQAPIFEKPLTHYTELKYKHVILQLFSLDGTNLLVKILQKINDYYQQPSLHTPIFASNQGFLILSLLAPCIELLKQMLTYVIQCRNTNFKDLTAIPSLLQTYNLFSSYPNSSACYTHAQQSCRNIIETLLVYTQPLSDEIHEKDSINKTVWSLMCGEVIKYITQAPYTFVSGLLIFSELLPLPLPIQTGAELTKEEVAWAGNLRKLWSAHLHPFNASIQEVISRLCSTTHAQLLNLLRRVCVQLADLAANTALVIARGIIDIVYKAFVADADSKIVCGQYHARILNFFACLVTHSTLKCAVLGLLGPKDDKRVSLLQLFGWVLKGNNSSSSHVQAQECVLSICQSFCDIEVALLQNSIDKCELNSDLYLSNALPGKENLLVIIGMILDFLQVENSFVTYLPALRTLLLLTEHDYGFYHLREQLLRRHNVFGVVLTKLSNSFVKENECLASLSTLLEFLRVCGSTEEVIEGVLYSPRKITMSSKEIEAMIGWIKGEEVTEGEDQEIAKKHELVVLEEILKALTDEDVTFESLLEGIVAVLKLLQAEEIVCGEGQEDVKLVEPVLPEPETLLVQFSGRLVYTTSEVCDDERLTIRYWLASPTEEGEYENVACDLGEVTRQFLPQDFTIVREIEKLCRICPMDNNGSEKEKRESDQKTKMKKPFITPVRSRGFPRTIQQRSDLFRSRPPNTSRPPSLHVDDFVALETCGAQPTGPTGYNKFSRDLLASSRVQIQRGSRGRSFVSSERSVHSRQMTWWGTSLSRGPYQ